MAAKTADVFADDASVTTNPKFTAFKRATDIVKFGSLTKMEDLQGVDVLLKSITQTNTDFGPAARIVCEDAQGEEHTLLTSGVAIYPKLLELAVQEAQGEIEFPLIVRFVKNGRAWMIE